MIQLLDVDEITIEFLDMISPTADRIAVSVGIACQNCGRRIEPVVMNGVVSPTAWKHLHKAFRCGAGCWCDDGDTKAETLIIGDE